MPPAVIAWLDYSQADQRRAREIVAMFSQAESRDEVGLGQIRDALSDTLFPGTPVIFNSSMKSWISADLPVPLAPMTYTCCAISMDIVRGSPDVPGMVSSI